LDHPAACIERGNHRRTLVDQNPGSKRAAITPSRFESGVTRSAIQLTPLRAE